MAQGAVHRESGGFVRWVSGPVEVGEMAADAVRTGQGVVVVDVARSALLGGVEPHQRETSGGVVEDGAAPIRRGVTAGAILREVGRLMRRIVGSVVIGLVTIPTGCCGQTVVAVCVALGALQAGMSAGQGEPGRPVVEGGASPVEGRGSVAKRAVLREAGGFVRRVGGAVEVGLVAVPAGCGGQAVVVIHVALCALQAGVRAGQGESGSHVVERGAGPVEDRGSVALGTVLRESGRFMRRVVGSVVVGLVASPTGRAGQAIVVVHVARGTLLSGVKSHQEKPCSRVVERGAGPVGGRGSVAQGAVHRESGGFVRWVAGPVEVGKMAVAAGRAGQAVVIIDVASGALLGGVESHQPETRGGVVEGGAVPIRRRVTPGTILREVGRLMRRIVGVVEIGLVTAPAGAARQIVVVAHVALRALQAGMRAGQGEPGRRVVEGGAGPVEGRGSVAKRAVLREAGGFVRRVVGSVEIGLVAAPAGRAVQGVVIIDVTRGALLGGVESHQREARGGVVESGAGPIDHGVAAGTILREARLFVRRVVGVVEIGLVTAPARPARQTEVVVRVALGALHAGMRAGQREPGSCVVEGGGAGPVKGRSSMAQGAVLREAGGFVRWVVGSVEVALVAVPAGRAGQAVVVVEVARRALLGGVEAQQLEPGGGVVESGAGPIGRGVAGSAVLREAGRRVVGTGGFLEIGQMTSHALLRRPRKYSVHVTLCARHAGMRSGQGETAQAMIERRA